MSFPCMYVAEHPRLEQGNVNFVQEVHQSDHLQKGVHTGPVFDTEANYRGHDKNMGEPSARKIILETEIGVARELEFSHFERIGI